MVSETIRFDETTSRYSHSDQPLPPGGVSRALRASAESAGLDPIAELYNEALRYATEGHLRLARERLTMLLCMAPDDGESRILLAKVHVAGQKWQEALSALDEAASCGQNVPAELRRAIEDHLRAEDAAKEEEVTAIRARDQGEVKALRAEARRLRSENANLVGRCADLEKETRKWAWTTAGVSTLASLFILASLVFGGGPADEVAVVEPENEPVAEVGPGVEAPVVAAAPMVVAPAEPVVSEVPLVERAAEALARAPSLDGSALEVEMNGTTAVVLGSVRSHRQLRDTEKVLGKVDGVAKVDLTKVTNTSLTEGAFHVVKKGDTLGDIAYEYYGKSSATAPILKANSKLLKGKATNLQVGQKLTLPALAK